MNERVLVLREAIVKIAQMLAGENIQVSQRGTKADVRYDAEGKPIEVVLPFIPENASIELCEAIQGFLDHEISKVLFTDYNAKLSAEASKNGVAQIMNAIEDARIERKMAEKYSGSGLNMATTGKFYLDKAVIPGIKKAAEEGDAAKVKGLMMAPMIRALAGQSHFKEFIKDRMASIQEVYDAMKPFESEIQNAETTKDAYEVALKIKKVLKGEAKGGGEGEDEDEDGSAKSRPSAAPSSKSSKKKETKPEKSKKPKSEKDEKEEKEKSEDEGEGEGEGEGEEKPEGEEGKPEGEGEEKSEGEGDGDGKNEESDGEDEDSGDEDGDAEGEAEESDGEGEMRQETAPVWNEIDFDSANDFDKLVSRAVSEDALAATAKSKYRVFSTEEDLIEPLKVGSAYRSSMFKDIADAVDHMVGPLQKDLERAVAARSMRAWEPGRKSGRLHAANLSRLMFNDSRVFRRRTETTTKDVAVELVIDISGSMSGYKVDVATKTAYALSQVLERIGIKHEVIAFTTGHLSSKLRSLYDAARKELKSITGKPYSRYEPLYMPIIKGFDERVGTTVRERFGWLPNVTFMRNNVDGECVQIAARRLAARREAGKVLIVLSDGFPAAHSEDGGALNAHLTQVVRDAEKAGMKVVGIGIQDSAVQKFYSKNLVINEIDELPSKVIKELRFALIQQ